MYKSTYLIENIRTMNPYEIFRTWKYKILQNKYKKNSFDKTFDWNWKDICYNRIALVNLLVGNKVDCSYLEIGCASNELFDSIPLKNKVGVDPQNGGTMRMTSDEFFMENKKSFDLIFIDGLHTYEQVRKDVVNSIKFLKLGGWIVLHDMLPENWTEEHVPLINPGSWTGDVWKVAFELSNTVGIDFKIIKIDHGVGAFRLNRNPSLVNFGDSLKDKRFPYFYENIKKLPIVEWEDCQNWLLSDYPINYA